MNSAPDPIQSARAINRANEVRFARAKLKKELRSLPRAEAFGMLADLLENPPAEIATAQPMELLLSVKRLGRYYALTWIRRAGVPEHRRVNELTVRQRGVLASLLRAGEGRLAA